MWIHLLFKLFKSPQRIKFYIYVYIYIICTESHTTWTSDMFNIQARLKKEARISQPSQCLRDTLLTFRSVISSEPIFSRYPILKQQLPNSITRWIKIIFHSLYENYFLSYKKKPRALLIQYLMSKSIFTIHVLHYFVECDPSPLGLLSWTKKPS